VAHAGPAAAGGRRGAGEVGRGQARAGVVRLVAEDPTLKLEINPETHQLVLWCLGEAHRDVLLDRLATRYGVAVETLPHRVSLRETFAGPRGAGAGT
jgi:elongation factor G